MPRLQVDIKWNDSVGAFMAYYEGTDMPIPTYSELTYGADSEKSKTDNTQDSSKTLKADKKPDKAYSCKGWVTVE